MRPVSGKRMCKILEEKGWSLKRIRGSHHRYVRGTSSVTVPVHKNDDLPTGTQRSIMRDAGLTDADL
jgi:predicted RNA binding protein YcfA (HicA-like mRNA interferase family)